MTISQRRFKSKFYCFLFDRCHSNLINSVIFWKCFQWSHKKNTMYVIINVTPLMELSLNEKRIVYAMDFDEIYENNSIKFVWSLFNCIILKIKCYQTKKNTKCPAVGFKVEIWKAIKNGKHACLYLLAQTLNRKLTKSFGIRRFKNLQICNHNNQRILQSKVKPKYFITITK